MDLPKLELGVSLTDFSLTYVYREPREKGQTGGKQIVESLRTLAKGAAQVFIGTDPDREGEAIAWHFARELGLNNPPRVEFHEITKGAIDKAIANPGRIDEKRVASQEARRALDRLVGYRVSPRLADLIGQNASAGRVQTPALRLIVEREREIKNFISREHYGAELSFDGGWKAEWRFKSLLPEGEKLWTDRSVADVVAGVVDVEVLSCDNTTSKRSPSPAFTTSTMQQAASAKLKMRPQQAMRAAQKLFESGHITYHRTDDPNLSGEGIDLIRTFATEQSWALPAVPRKWKSKAGAQEAHEGIRPTHVENVDAGETDDEKALYRLIRLRAVASQLADAEYDVRTVVLRSVHPVLGTGPAEFVASGRVLKVAGWRAIVGDTVSDDDEQEERNNPVPQLQGGTKLQALSGATQVKKTEPPAAFTDGTLIKELEKREIGRPSTYASITSTLDIRSYVELDKQRRLHPTKLGEVVIDALVAQKFSFADYSFTRLMEGELDKIATGASRYVDVVRAGNTVLDQEIARLDSSDVPRLKREGPPCPTCKAGVLVKRKGKHGAFWSCDAFRTNGCKALFRDQRGKPDFTPRVTAVIDENAPTCPKCSKGKLVARESKHGRFYGCSNFKDGCKVAFKSLDDAIAPQATVA